jgi:hypothetical protein
MTQPSENQAPVDELVKKEEQRLNRIIYEGTSLNSWGLGLKKQSSVKEKSPHSAPVTPKKTESVTPSARNISFLDLTVKQNIKFLVHFFIESSNYTAVN